MQIYIKSNTHIFNLPKIWFNIIPAREISAASAMLLGILKELMLYIFPEPSNLLKYFFKATPNKKHNYSPSLFQRGINEANASKHGHMKPNHPLYGELPMEVNGIMCF